MSIPRITPDMVAAARQQAEQAAPPGTRPTPEPAAQTQWDLDRAAAQRLAANNPRRRGSRTVGATGGFPAQQRPAAGDTTGTFTMPAAYRMPGAQSPAAGDTTATFTMPPAYDMPKAREPAVGDTTATFTMPPAYDMARKAAASPTTAFEKARAQGSAQIRRPRPAEQPAPPASAAPAAESAPDLATSAAAAPALAAPAPAKAAPGRARLSRAQAEARLYQSIHDDHLWLNNPVMVRGLGLAPAIVAATNGRNALLLCAAAALLLTATRVLAVLLCHLLGHRQRPLLYVVCGALVYIPAYCILYAALGADLNLLGIYLPLLVTDPMIIKRMEAPELESPQEALRRGVNNTLGVCAALLLLGMLRELLGAGTLFGSRVLAFAVLPLASQPAGGFLLMGLMAALWTAVGGHYVHYKQEEVRHLYAEHRQ